ncbi:MAG: SagB/ThcOx family dehydrogenase [Planctomycetota bacterium]|jgi:SagB-type dehydrogenase family enzyme
MKVKTYLVCTMAIILVTVTVTPMVTGSADHKNKILPPPDLTGKMSVQQALMLRRSCREFSDKPLTVKQIGQLCWAGQGITDKDKGFRTAPSAGALYPIELYMVTAQGIDRYNPKEHSLQRYMTGNHKKALQTAGLDQESIGRVPVCFVITAVVERTAKKYGKKAEQYCMQESGHVAQNILLQATALKLAGLPIGGYKDQQVTDLLKLPKNHRVLYILPIGHPKQH